MPSTGPTPVLVAARVFPLIVRYFEIAGQDPTPEAALDELAEALEAIPHGEADDDETADWLAVFFEQHYFASLRPAQLLDARTIQH